MVRKIINQPNNKLFEFFGFLLLAVFVVGIMNRMGQQFSINSISLFVVLLLMLLLTIIEIPVWRMRTRKPVLDQSAVEVLSRTYDIDLAEEIEEGEPKAYNSLVTLNLGGFIMPLIMAIYLSTGTSVTAILMITIILIIATYFISEVQSGVGVVVPDYAGILPIPLAIIIAPSTASVAPIILASGVFGIIFGAIGRLLARKEDEGSYHFNLGGVGTFKPIYVTVLVSAMMSGF